MKTQKGKDYSQLIIWTSALVGMIRYSAAFLSSDMGSITGALSDYVTFLLGVSGFAMGILGTLGTTYIFDGWRQKMPKTGDKWNNKFIALTLFVMLAIVSEVLILVPFTMSRILHVSVADVLQGGVWWWSTSVVVMPFLLIGGVSVSNQIVTVTANTANEQANGSLIGSPETNEQKAGARTFASLTNSEKYYIINEKSDAIANEWGVTQRAIQKWRKRVQEEIAQGKLQ